VAPVDKHHTHGGFEEGGDLCRRSDQRYNHRLETRSCNITAKLTQGVDIAICVDQIRVVE